ncbi:unnamed protein product [Effrenium voratum]|uniref:Uncharacterized protein n=1 Tax=Effrenium voratum TaxID=2562239 RepID=A0AA36JSL7_9DINO|nr:unnamed protein product [Effrenium voratum]CAJ1429415.1 unnamed protein product [Effrenium voratum]
MALVFMLTDSDEGMTPYFIPTGRILDGNDISKFAVSDADALQEHLMKMTKEQITETLAKLSLKPNRKSLTKLNLATLIAGKMTFLSKRASSISQASSSATPVHGYSAKAKKNDDIVIRVKPYDHRCPSLDIGTMEIPIRLDMSVSTLLVNVSEKLSEIFKDYDWKLVLKFKDEFLTNSIHALWYVGFTKDNCYAVFDESDPNYHKIFEDVVKNGKVEKPFTGVSDFTVEEVETNSEASESVEEQEIIDWLAQAECNHYQNSAIDFFENVSTLSVCDHSGDKVLFDIPIDKDFMSLSMLHHEIENRLTFVTSKSEKKVITESELDFIISATSKHKTVLTDMNDIEYDRMYLFLRIRGGGKNADKVIKTYLKKDTPTSLGGEDKWLFDKIVGSSPIWNAMTADEVRRAFNDLDLAVLRGMEDFLKHGKVTNANKPQMMVEMLPAIQEMDTAIAKIVSNKKKVKTIVMDYIKMVCGDEEGSVKVVKLVKFIEGRIAVKLDKLAETEKTGGDVSM